MLNAILINLKKQFPDCVFSEKKPRKCEHYIPWATPKLWEHKDFSVFFQERDAPDAYFALLEIRTTLKEFSFTFDTVMPDLFWIYAKLGICSVSVVDQEDQTLDLEKGEYCIAYAKNCTYRITVRSEITIIPVFVLPEGWISRYADSELSRFTNIMAELIKRNATCILSRKLAIDQKVVNEFSLLLGLPEQFCLTQDSEMYVPITRMVELSYHALEENREIKQKNASKERIDMVRASIQEKIQKEIVFSLADIAGDHEKSTQHFNDLNKKHYNNQTLEQFVKETKLVWGMHLRKLGFTSTEVTDKLNYGHLSNFSNIFFERFKIWPSDVKAYEDK